MTVGTLCQRDVVTVPATGTVRDGATLMRNEHVGAPAVTGPYEPGKVIGIVTERDLVVDLLAGGHPVDGQAMQRSGVRRLLVMGEGGEVVGLLSADDLLGQVAGELGALAATLRDGVRWEGTRQRARGAADPARPLFLTRNEP